MAIIKSTTFKGFTAEYWNSKVQINDGKSNKTRATMGLYKDKASRLDDEQVNLLMTKMIEIDGAYLTPEQLWTGIKAHPDFTGSTDDI